MEGHVAAKISVEEQKGREGARQDMYFTRLQALTHSRKKVRREEEKEKEKGWVEYPFNSLSDQTRFAVITERFSEGHSFCVSFPTSTTSISKKATLCQTLTHSHTHTHRMKQHFPSLRRKPIVNLISVLHSYSCSILRQFVTISCSHLWLCPRRCLGRDIIWSERCLPRCNLGSRALPQYLCSESLASLSGCGVFALGWDQDTSSVACVLGRAAIALRLHKASLGVD